MTEWLLKGTGDALSNVKQELRCCFCWRGPATGTNGAHMADRCNFLSAWAKKRASQEVRLGPIVVMEGYLSIPSERLSLTLEKLAVDFNKNKQEVTGQIGALDKRLTTLKGVSKRKRGSQDQQTRSQNTSTSRSAPGPGPQNQRTPGSNLQPRTPSHNGKPTGQGSGAKGKKGKGKQHSG